VKHVETIVGPNAGINILVNNAAVFTTPKQNYLDELKKSDLMNELSTNVVAPAMLSQVNI